MNTEHTRDQTTDSMDDDLPGANWETGPRLEKLNGTYAVPLILDDAATLTSRLAIRAGFVADYIEVNHSHALTDILVDALRRVSVTVGYNDAHILPRRHVDEEELTDHGATITEGFRGLWAVVENLDDVQKSMKSEKR